MTNHMDFIESVAREDIAALREKEHTYRGSWKKRGGVGAFMMLARKWDRLETILNCDNITYDVFKAIEMSANGVDGSALAEVRDLRRYLLLVEAEMAARGVIRAGPPVKAPEPLDKMSTSGLRAQLIDLGRSPSSPVGDALALAIRDELERREHRPGSADDGGHHARQDIVPEGGAFDMVVGDRVVCDTPGHTYYGRAGIAKEFLQDGDAYVQLDGEQGYAMIKWNHLSKAP